MQFQASLPLLSPVNFICKPTRVAVYFPCLGSTLYIAKHKSQTNENAIKINGKKLKKTESAGLKKRKSHHFSAFWA
ncbi:hypothetical protein AWJ19_32900 [Paenibacillus sp. DMB5]|nr:hypothetical protein AWJ19_32900 [Paenibacillus sp. DMB5]